MDQEIAFGVGHGSYAPPGLVSSMPENPTAYAVGSTLNALSGLDAAG